MTQSICIGDKVTFGRYPQGMDGEVAPLKWSVLAVDGESVLLLADKLIECMPYHPSAEEVTWEHCGLRGWLNGTFFDSAFDDAEQARIVTVTNRNHGNVKSGMTGGNATADRVFLLSLREVDEYLPLGTDRKVYSTPYALRHREKLSKDKSGSLWWLRSPGDAGSYAANVHYIGGVNAFGNPVNDPAVGVRPALWLRPES